MDRHARGLERLREGRFLAYGRAEGLSADAATAVLEDRSGNLWIGTDHGVDRFAKGVISSYSSRDGLAPGAVRAIHEDRAGAIWFGTSGGLTRRAQGRFIDRSRAAGFAIDYVRAILEDRQGTLFVGTSRGLVSLRGPSVRRYSTGDGLTRDAVYALLEDRRGDLWIGTFGGGLNRLSGGRFTALTTAQGLSNDFVLSLHEDREGSLWIGTLGGLNRLRNGKLATFTVQHGLFDDVVYRILEDGDGNFWIGANKGIFRVRRRDLDEVADGRRASVASVAFGPSDGMRSAESNGAAQPAGWRTRDGRLWFSTSRGAVSVDPARPRGNLVIPPVLIEQVIADRRPRPPEREVAVPPGRGELELRYTALSFANPRRVMFRYRLEGFDHEWVEAGDRRVAYYTNIPPGRYRFRVVASNDEGLWNLDGDSVELALEPHAYETWYFYGACVMALTALTIGGYRLRIGRVRRREQELARLVEERTRQLEELNRELKRLAALDSVTGLANRRQFQDTLAHEWRRALRDRTPLALIMVDIDYFKAYNDGLGHQAGDDCLRLVARALAETARRPGDLVARYGGEEFALILPKTDAQGALDLAERLRLKVQALDVPHPHPAAEGHVTISAGVAAVVPIPSEVPDSLTAAADRALYRAKQAGRNRVAAPRPVVGAGL